MQWWFLDQLCLSYSGEESPRILHVFSVVVAECLEQHLLLRSGDPREGYDDEDCEEEDEEVGGGQGHGEREHVQHRVHRVAGPGVGAGNHEGVFFLDGQLGGVLPSQFAVDPRHEQGGGCRSDDAQPAQPYGQGYL